MSNKEIPDRILEKYPFIALGEITTPDNLDRAAYDYLADGLKYAEMYRNQGGEKPITLIINGRGGNTQHAAAIIDTIQEMGNIIGIIQGEALSAHAYIWLACKYRDMTRNSIFGVHQNMIDVTDATEKELLEYANEMHISNLHLVELLVDASNEHYDFHYWDSVIRSVSDNYVSFDIERATKHGLINSNRKSRQEVLAETRAAYIERFGLSENDKP